MNFEELTARARKVVRPADLNASTSVGYVGAALLTDQGHVYTGVNLDPVLFGGLLRRAFRRGRHGHGRGISRGQNGRRQRRGEYPAALRKMPGADQPASSGKLPHRGAGRRGQGVYARRAHAI